MNTLLVSKLIKNGVVREGTEFQAYYNAPGLSCTTDARIVGRFVILGAKRSGTTIIFEAVGQNIPMQRFPCDDVISIDGMNIERIAKVYNLDVNGGDMVVSKRRGRKARK